MGHAYERIPDNESRVKIEKKGKHLNNLEIYHIYKLNKNPEN
jgi:hypothetical protein